MKEKIRIYKNILKHRINVYKEKRNLSKLAKHSDPKIKAIGEALLETYKNDLSKEELKNLLKIEERRKQLQESEEIIPVIDYGAGKSGQKRTKEEMKSGVRSTAKVSDVCKASKPRLWATILFKLTRKLKPQSTVELGSCVGISTHILLLP